VELDPIQEFGIPILFRELVMRSRVALVASVLFSSVAFAATPAEQALQQQLNKLQALNAAHEKQISVLQAEIQQGNAKVNQLQADLKKAKGNDGTDDKTIKSLQTQLDTLRKVKTIRTIVYKTKADTTKTEIQSLTDDANQYFATVKAVRGVWAAKASTDSSEYQVVIVLLFDDANGLQTFQKDPQWKRFTDKHAKMWEEPKYYDGTIGK
jgi:vacuolar-type H+-ATPase subunit I/STV1